MRRDSSELPHRATNLTRLKAGETRQKRAGFDTAEHSDEVGETPASDSGLAAVAHLGRACAGAYRGEDECSGGFGAEVGSLVWPAATGGARPAMASRRSTAAAALANGGGRRGRSGGDRMEPGDAGCCPDRGKPVGRAASTTPTYGSHVAGVGWTKAGVRARKRERGETGPHCLSGPKGRRVSPAAPAAFYFLFF